MDNLPGTPPAAGRELPARRSSIRPLVRFVVEFAARHHLEEIGRWELELLTEEILANIVEHAYDPRGQGTVRVTCSRPPGSGLQVEFSDRGVPFDPLAYPPMPCFGDLQEADTSGYGIPLIRRLADSISYRRRRGANHLRIEKHPCRR